jgi:hypothetical protein
MYRRALLHIMTAAPGKRPDAARPVGITTMTALKIAFASALAAGALLAAVPHVQHHAATAATTHVTGLKASPNVELCCGD